VLARRCRPSLLLPLGAALTGLALTLALLVPSVAVAQLRRATMPVWQPPVSITAPDDALAVSIDPAALPYLRSWSLAYVHAEADESLSLESRGDAIYAATPLFLGFAIGAGVDSVRPTSAARTAGAIEHTALSLALAWAYSDQIAIGATARVMWSSDPRLDDLFTLDLAATWRPLPYFAASFLARDVTGPGFQDGAVGFVPRSFLLGVGVRPFGTRALGLDLLGAIDEEGRVGARLAAEVEVPYVGRLQAATEIERVGDPSPSFRVTGGVSVDWGRIGAGGGVIVGDGISAAPGWYVHGHVEGFERPGVPTGSYVADLAIAEQGSRSLLWTTRRLDRAIRDPRIHGVVLRFQGSDIGLAYAQELRMMIEELTDAGKPVVCYLGDASGAELYACGGARTVLMDPAGGVRLYGPGMEILHLAGLLRELGIRADFVRIGPYKSAIEEYQDDRMSDAARGAREVILDDVYHRMVWDLSRDLEVPEARVREMIDDGPYVAREALDAQLVDGTADEHDMREELERAFGGSYTRETVEPDHPRRRWGRTPRVGVVVVDGEMVDGNNVDIPLLEIHATGGRTAVEAITAMARDPAVGAIVVRIDSPGGSVLAADQIWRAIRRARDRKPVIASIGAVGASGGYYIASACDEIWADPATITGSIGVWFGKIDFEPLAERFGVHTEFLARGRHAGAESLWRPFTPEERAMLADKIREWYRDFLSRVAEGRGMSLTEVDAVARGRVWTGDRALELGLVDRLGGFYSALLRARQLGGLPDDADFEVRPSRPSSLLDYVLGDSVLGDLLGAAQSEGGGGGEGGGEAQRGASASGGAEGEALGTLAPEAVEVLRTVWIVRRAQTADAPMARLPMRIDF
jgi:protease-4